MSGFPEIEPKIEYISDDENQEPATKKAKEPEATSSSGSAFGVLETMIAENRKLSTEVSSLKTDVKNLHTAALEISNAALRDSQKLEARISRLEAELREKNEKLEAINRENSKFTAKHILDYKSSTETEIRQLREKISSVEYENGQFLENWAQTSMETEISGVRNELSDGLRASEEKQEHAMVELKEYLGKFQNAELNILTLLEDKVKALENSRNPMEERLSKMEMELKGKIKAYAKVLQDCRECMAEMKKASGNQKTTENEHAQEVSIDQKPLIANRSILRYDDCFFPPTRAELDYQHKCIFCKSKTHLSIECRNVPEFTARIRVLQKQNRCLKCLDLCDPDEHHHCPREKVMCSNCEWDTQNARKDKDFHHPIICRYNDQSQTCQKRRTAENERRIRHGVPPRFVI